MDTVGVAALQALEALTPSESARFEGRVHAGHSEAAAEYYTFRLVAERLLDGAPVTPPPAGLRDRLMARIAVENDEALERSAPAETVSNAEAAGTQVWRRWANAPGGDGVFTLRADESGWETTDIPGIAVRNLYADQDRHYVTMLVRMDRGTAYPTHRHAGVEECYVLQGDLRVPPDRHLHAGDYQRADAASLHGVQSTDEGCLLLIVSSTDDELV